MNYSKNNDCPYNNQNDRGQNESSWFGASKKNEQRSKPLNEYALASLRPRNAFSQDSLSCNFCCENPEIRRAVTPPPRVRNTDNWSRTVHFGNTSYDNTASPSRIIAGCQHCGSPQGECTCEIDCDCLRCQCNKQPSQYVNSPKQQNTCCQKPPPSSIPRFNLKCDCMSSTINYHNQNAPRCSFDCDDTPSSSNYCNRNSEKPNCSLCQVSFEDDLPTTSMPSMRKQSSCGRCSMSPATMRHLVNTELNNSLFCPQKSTDSVSRMVGSQTMSKEKEALLIEDTYTPGIIEDCVECNKDFNAVSFGMYFESLQHIPKDLPELTPMSLVEAFRKRIDVEREHLLDALNCQGKKRELTIESTRLYFSYKPKTELNKALFHLYQAEILFDERKTTFENATKDDKPYILEMQKTQQPLVGGSPITVDAFIGTTKLKCGRSGGGENENDTKKSNSKFGCQKRGR